tara:strand:- start:27 stop:854 length:828 start_codon:yes stop_codon:yes gene_type:complete
MKKPRVVCWYSHGAASLIAAKLAILKQPELYPNHDIVVACIHLENEYHEPERMESVESFLGRKVIMLRDEKYNANVDVVIEKTRYMSGVFGARCTKELKKSVRINWQRDNDIHVFGMDCNESDRIDNLIDSEPDLNLWAPLIDKKLSKKDCFAIMQEAGIELPKMYKLGYHNNNCIGCLKASGAGYWNKIRKDFPDVFDKRAAQEKGLNVALTKMSERKVKRLHPETIIAMESDGYAYKVDARGTMRIPLRYLHPDAGNHKDLDIGDCGFFCETT